MKTPSLALLPILTAAAISFASPAPSPDMGMSDKPAASGQPDVAAMPMTPLGGGDKIPPVTVLDEHSQPHDLSQLVREQPSVLIFYRGGWCPYCSRQLSALVDIEDDLRAAGYQLLAISADQPMKLRETPNRGKLNYRLFSDNEMKAADAFGISFEMKPESVRMYKEKYDIDLEAASGRKHHKLPHPAVYVADAAGTIRFAHVNPDYKERLEPEKIVQAAKDATMPSKTM